MVNAHRAAVAAHRLYPAAAAHHPQRRHRQRRKVAFALVDEVVNTEFLRLNQADHRAGKVKRVRRASHQVVGNRQLLMILR